MDQLSPSDIRRIGDDPDVFEAFYREHVVKVRRFIARRVDDPFLVADLTADVFVAVIEASAGYRPDRGCPAAWLFGIARNVVADHVRRRARERRVAGRIAGRRLLDSDSIARIEEAIDAERDLRRVFRALGRLPERDRQLVELVALDGLSVTQAAAVLGVRPATARVRLHRGRTRVHAILSTNDTADSVVPLSAEVSR